MTDNLTEARPKRVLHIGKYFPPHRGGMETLLRDQMNMQTRDEGQHVAAVVHSSERRLIDKVEIQPQGYRVRFAARWLTTVFAPIAPFFWLSVLREIHRLDPDEIKIHMPNVSAFWLLMLPRAYACSWFILWHSDVVPSKYSFGLRAFYWFYKPLETLLLKRANTVAATSLSYLTSSRPLSAFSDKCIVTPVVLDSARVPVERFLALRPEKKPGEGMRIVCVGRLTYYKGFDVAIKALAQLPTAHLRIVGEGDLKAQLTSLVSTLGLTSRVKFLGDVSEEILWEQYAWCDIHCLPSVERTEAFGLTVMEAALFNRPSVVSRLEGSGLLWNAQNTGLSYESCEPGNAESLARALRRLGQAAQ